jgi:colanic acid biosynthesis glycosyl transferase WcaI
MKITFICAVFPPEPAPAGVMAQQLAARLVRDGHTVTMVVPFPNRPEGKLYPGFRRRLRTRTESADGYSIVHCANWLIGKRRRMRDRLLENITFGLSSTWAALREGRPDLIIIETWALFAISFTTLLARLWGVPYLYYVQDLFPEAAEQAGLLRPNGLLARAFRSWDRSLCLHSASTIVISEKMRSLLAANRGLPLDVFSVVSNWIDESAFPVWKGENDWRRSLGISDETFVALFAGTLGHVSGAEVLVEVAQILREQQDVLLLCIGEGVRKEKMMAEASRLKLHNLRFLPFQPADRVPEIQASCQAALLTMDPKHSDSSVPSKLISYLAASRPVICAAHGDSTVGQVVRESGAGIVVPPGNAHSIAEAILQLKGDPDLRRQMGFEARRHFENHFTLEQAHRRFGTLLESMAN